MIHIPFLVGWCEKLGHRNQPLHWKSNTFAMEKHQFSQDSGENHLFQWVLWLPYLTGALEDPVPSVENFDVFEKEIIGGGEKETYS